MLAAFFTADNPFGGSQVRQPTSDQGLKTKGCGLWETLVQTSKKGRVLWETRCFTEEDCREKSQGANGISFKGLGLWRPGYTKESRE